MQSKGIFWFLKALSARDLTAPKLSSRDDQPCALPGLPPASSPYTPHGAFSFIHSRAEERVLNHSACMSPDEVCEVLKPWLFPKLRLAAVQALSHTCKSFRSAVHGMQAGVWTEIVRCVLVLQ